MKGEGRGEVGDGPEDAPAASSPSSSRTEESPASRDMISALTLAMAIAPGVYSRNKHFSLHQKTEAKTARRRAALVRGIVRHLGKACDLQVSETSDDRVRLSYRVPSLAFERTTELSRVELACVRYLARKSDLETPEEIGAASNADDDQLVVETMLARLGPTTLVRRA